jgi:hypothetical protein
MAPPSSVTRSPIRSILDHLGLHPPEQKLPPLREVQ